MLSIKTLDPKKPQYVLDSTAMYWLVVAFNTLFTYNWLVFNAPEFVTILKVNQLFANGPPRSSGAKPKLDQEVLKAPKLELVPSWEILT